MSCFWCVSYAALASLQDNVPSLVLVQRPAPVGLRALLYQRIHPLFRGVLAGPAPPQTNEETWGYTLPALKIEELLFLNQVSQQQTGGGVG